MSNYIFNKLSIQSSNEELMKLIKKYIYQLDKSNTKTITMNLLIPLWGKGHSISDYREWGTKSDMMNAKIEFEDKTTLYLTYDTAWSPNYIWVEALCMYIQSLYNLGLSESDNMSINHIFYDWFSSGYGGYMIWNPSKEVEYHNYDIMEFMYWYDLEFHYYLVEKMGYNPFNPQISSINKLSQKLFGNDII